MKAEISVLSRHIWGFWVAVAPMLAGFFVMYASPGAGPVFALGTLVTLLVFQLGTERIAARLPRRGGPELAARVVGLAVALLVAGGTFWAQTAWFARLRAADLMSYMELTAGEQLYQNALLLLATYALAVPLVLAWRSRRTPGEDAPGPPAWRPLPQLLDVVVIAVGLSLFFTDGDVILRPATDGCPNGWRLRWRHRSTCAPRESSSARSCWASAASPPGRP